MALVWTAWNSGAHPTSGTGYGFKVPFQTATAKISILLVAEALQFVDL